MIITGTQTTEMTVEIETPKCYMNKREIFTDYYYIGDNDKYICVTVWRDNGHVTFRNFDRLTDLYDIVETWREVEISEFKTALLQVTEIISKEIQEL